MSNILTEQEVLNYVKYSVGLPFQYLELSDEDILENAYYVLKYEFSPRLPDINEVVLDKNDPKVKTDRSDMYLLIDPDNQQIYTVIKVIPSITSAFIEGVPYPGPMTPSLQTTQQTVWTYFQGPSHTGRSDLQLTYRFFPPNLLQILPNQVYLGGSKFVVRYTRSHPSFATIPGNYTSHFLKLVQARIYEILGMMRTKFELNTPWGSIQLNGSELLSRADQIRQEVYEDLKNRPPDVLLEIA